MSTSLERYPRRGELSGPVRAWHWAQSSRIFLTDILPILIRSWTRQRARDAVRRLTFLTAEEQEAVERWLRSRGF